MPLTIQQVKQASGLSGSNALGRLSDWGAGVHLPVNLGMSLSNTIGDAPVDAVKSRWRFEVDRLKDPTSNDPNPLYVRSDPAYSENDLKNVMADVIAGLRLALPLAVPRVRISPPPATTVQAGSTTLRSNNMSVLAALATGAFATETGDQLAQVLHLAMRPLLRQKPVQRDGQEMMEWGFKHPHFDRDRHSKPSLIVLAILAVWTLFFGTALLKVVLITGVVTAGLIMLALTWGFLLARRIYKRTLRYRPERAVIRVLRMYDTDLTQMPLNLEEKDNLMKWVSKEALVTDGAAQDAINKVFFEMQKKDGSYGFKPKDTSTWPDYLRPQQGSGLFKVPKWTLFAISPMVMGVIWVVRLLRRKFHLRPVIL